MSKDLLVDNCIAKNFCNPLDDHYKTFIRWLFEEGELVVTQSLLRDYYASTAASPSPTNIVIIVAKLTADGRLCRFTKQDLDYFQIPKRITRCLRSNRKDWDNIKAVMLSTRKFAISLDNGFVFDVNNYPGYSARAERRPQDLPYR
jgi:hypothetical protein